jgi:hypothetical protein
MNVSWRYLGAVALKGCKQGNSYDSYASCWEHLLHVLAWLEISVPPQRSECCKQQAVFSRGNVRSMKVGAAWVPSI